MYINIRAKTIGPPVRAFDSRNLCKNKKRNMQNILTLCLIEQEKFFKILSLSNVEGHSLFYGNLVA